MHQLITTHFFIPQREQTKSVWKLIKMSRNKDAGNLLYYLYHQNCYKLIGIDLSRQTNRSIPQQINFVGKLKEDDGVKMLLLSEIILTCPLDSLIVT